MQKQEKQQQQQQQQQNCRFLLVFLSVGALGSPPALTHIHPHLTGYKKDFQLIDRFSSKKDTDDSKRITIT